MSAPGRTRRSCWPALVGCVLALAACTTLVPRHGPAPRPTAGQASLARPSASPPSFPRLEGVYWQGSRSFVVTYQGWWLDLRTQQIRQLTPAGGGVFTYGPGWQVSVPVQGQLHFSTDAAGIPVRVTGTAPGRVPVNAVRVPTTERDVRFASQGAMLAGTLSIPPGPEPHPGIVILQGSGALDRHFESISQGIYLSLGFAVLAFDKRGVGASTGVFPGELATPASIGIQAVDAAAAARFMMAQPGIDARQVGFDANSQGGWVAPLAAQRLPSLNFAILIASPAVTTAQQDLYASFSGGSQYVPAQSDRAVDSAVRATAGGYDPAPALAALHIPALWIYGQLDRQVPVRLSLANLAAYHNPRWTVLVLPGGSHGLIATRHGLDTELDDATRFAPGYFTTLSTWVAAHITFPG
jgi:pimeloyl-ACP methyl ester carboxylesterase